MQGKKLYSTEIKHEIVQRYLDGRTSFNDLAKEYHVNKADVQKWLAAFREHGIEGLCTIRRTYTGEFKVSVVEYMHNTGTSIRQTAAYFNIPSHPTISTWERIYYEEGKEALFKERRGRANKMGTKLPNKQKCNIRNNEDLLAEVQRLRMENEYLKKLNALIQKWEKLEKPTK